MKQILEEKEKEINKQKKDLTDLNNQMKQKEKDFSQNIQDIQ